MKEFKANIRLIARVFLNKYCLFVVNGFLLAGSLFFYMYDSYERGIIKALADDVTKKSSRYNSEDSLLMKSLHLTHYLEERRDEIFEDKSINDVYTDVLRPVTYDLMTAKGACGSYSMVLGSILRDLGFNVRFAQMKVKDIWGGHIVIEAQTKKGWVVLDPSFDLSFKKPDGNFASFRDVQNNWAYYRRQVPSDYMMEYAYEDVRYTNWTKIPVIMPAIKSLCKLFIGKEATENLSVRIYFIRKFRILCYFMMISYAFSWVFIIRRYFRKREEDNIRRAIRSRMKRSDFKVA